MIRKDPVWKCKVGLLGEVDLPDGPDLPMREAVQRAFKELTGVDAQFVFSGWGGELSDMERSIVLGDTKH